MGLDKICIPLLFILYEERLFVCGGPDFFSLFMMGLEELTRMASQNETPPLKSLSGLIPIQTAENTQRQENTFQKSHRFPHSGPKGPKCPSNCPEIPRKPSQNAQIEPQIPWNSTKKGPKWPKIL